MINFYFNKNDNIHKNEVQDRRIKNAKTVMFKMDVRTPGIDYRVASLFIRYLTTKGIIPKGLN